MKTVEQKAKRVPAIRFAGFDDEWVEKKLGEMASFSKGMGYSKGDLKENGTPIVLYGRLYTKYETIISDVDTFADAKSNSVYSKGGEVIVPGSGETAEDISIASVVKKSGVLLGGDLNVITPPKNLDSVFLAISISNGKPHSDMAKMAQGKSVVHLHNTDLAEINLPYPNIIEQQKIGSFFSNIDSLISLEQKKYDKLTQVKKSMLEKMFPKEGTAVPEIRFAGFTGDWIRKKIGDVVVIERGGSPRPIEKFITKDENGLNWVKIGDAPEQGNYITRTAEKIIPEGLTKTREVHPGDLILSNSMSFGRPYIMSIDGCIHDGWLLIRNSKNVFDLKFLCTLLGTENMLSQYKAMAAGSTVNNLNKELVASTIVYFPKVDEQQKIGSYFTHLDSLISLQQRKLEKLKNIKKSLLEKMFV